MDQVSGSSVTVSQCPYPHLLYSHMSSEAAGLLSLLSVIVLDLSRAISGIGWKIGDWLGNIWVSPKWSQCLRKRKSGGCSL